MKDYNVLEYITPDELKKFIGEKGRVLVVGLGNREITSDSIGPNTCEKILATRHIVGEFSRNLGIPNLKSVATIIPSVLGKTGIETAEIIKALSDKLKPEAVILIDALSAMSMDRIFKTATCEIRSPER